MAWPVSGMEWTSALRSTIAVINGASLAWSGWKALVEHAGLLVLQRHHVAELARAGGVPKLRQRLGFDLADPLPGEGELASDLLEGAGFSGDQAEAQRQDLLLPVGQRVEHPPQVLLAQREGCRLEGALRLRVLDEVAELRVLVAHRLVDRDRLGQHAECLPDPVPRHLGRAGDLVDGRLTPQGLDQLPLDLPDPVERVHHVDPDADR